jgi:O-antigen/teichoic acid export membrane protein
MVCPDIWAGRVRECLAIRAGIIDVMPNPTMDRAESARRFPHRVFERIGRPGLRALAPRRIASNFAILGFAEVACRTISVFITLSLARRLGKEGFGRVEFAFQIVFWLVLIIRDCFETIVTREIARHPRITRGLVNRILGVKISLALGLLLLLAAAGQLTLANPIDRWVLTLYGLLMLTTAVGLDFVYRGKETVGLVALSLCVRTAVYCAGVWFWVDDPSKNRLIPTWLAVGEVTGIALVWVVYARQFGVPRPTLGLRFLKVFFRRGRSVGLIHLCQAVIVSADLTVVGLVSQWSEVGDYGAALRIVSAIMAFGLIWQQVVFPSLSRSWLSSAGEGRRVLDFAVRVLVTGFIPVAVGGTVLREPLTRFLLPEEYHGTAGVLLAVGIWRAPVLSLAFLYQTSLIAMDRESEGVRLLVWGSICSAPMIAALRWWLGLPGASLGVLLIGVGLVAAGYARLAAWRCQPSGFYLWRPLVASAVMTPVCLAAAGAHVLLAVLLGGVAYLVTLRLIGGLEFRDFTLGDRLTHEGNAT